LLNYHSLSSEFLSAIKSDSSAVIIIDADESDSLLTIRHSFLTLINEGVKNPAIIRKRFAAVGIEEFTNYASIDVGGSLLDGFSDGIWLESADIPLTKVNSISFGILQATRTRISKTEYISCPSCGRTLFDLQETTARVREKTNHLKGVKIAIMGCIVNGPGEMADADYGYVGSGPGKITLYKGKEVIKRSINSDIAVNELVELIKSGGDWSDPS
ncbi:1-hydroxy-2-methyl-2-(E)-butenyl 4-diphosphate synthase, partial [bacterium]